MIGDEVIATVGTEVSFRTVAEACVAEFPAVSEWLAVILTVAESERAEAFTVADQAEPEHTGEAEMPPTVTETI